MGPTDLLQVVIPTETVPVADSEQGLTVRGISLNDAMRLYYRYEPQLNALFEQFKGRMQQAQPIIETEVRTAAGQMISATPQLLAEIIALGCDSDPDDVSFGLVTKHLMKLPAGTQMETLQAIGRLTFTSEMPPPKFIGLVLEMAQSATAALTAQRRAA